MVSGLACNGEVTNVSIVPAAESLMYRTSGLRQGNCLWLKNEFDSSPEWSNVATVAESKS
jgi:hypothetical protein